MSKSAANATVLHVEAEADIEVTPEMIEAGAAPIFEWRDFSTAAPPFAEIMEHINRRIAAVFLVPSTLLGPGPRLWGR